MKTQIRTLDVAYNVFCRFEQCAEVKHYPGLVALYALAQLAVVSQNPHDCEQGAKAARTVIRIKSIIRDTILSPIAWVATVAPIL